MGEVETGMPQLPLSQPGHLTHSLTENCLVGTLRRQLKESQLCPLERDEVWSENTKRPCPFPWQRTDVGDGLYFRSTVKTDFHLQRPSQAGVWCRHVGARSLSRNGLGLTLESEVPSPPLPRAGGRDGEWPTLPRCVSGCRGRASLFTYLEPSRGSGKGNLLSRFLRRDHICSRRKRCFLGSGYSRKDVGFYEAVPEGPWDLEEPRTAPHSGLGVLCPWVPHPRSAGELPPRRAAMALRNVPFRSEVLAWDPDSLADYFRKVSLPLCCWRGWQCPQWAGRGLKMGSRQNMRGLEIE